MPDPTNPPNQDKQRLVNMTVIALVGQVGCLTLLIVIGAVFAGHVDRQPDEFETGGNDHPGGGQRSPCDLRDAQGGARNPAKIGAGIQTPGKL